VSSLLERAREQSGRRLRQLRDLWRAEGFQGVTERARSAFARRLAAREVVMPVDRADLLAADLSRPPRAVVPKLEPGQPIQINWVTTPPAPGSGGHTTMFRIVRYLQAHGYRNRIYFYDVYRGDHRYYESVVRRYYGFDGPVARLTDGLADAHAVVATSSPTAYPVFNARCTGKRFYFVQDFEPYFHPVGATSVLAENTYRMGFHAITAGRWLSQKLSAEFGMTCDHFDFGCDTARYHRLPDSRPRSGVVFYARPEAARRGFELGLLAMEIFAARRPGVELHFYGERMGKLPFAFVDHGLVTPDQLNALYNRSFAGLSLSLTNVSLVPHEMLAAGCIPVVNDAERNRIVLDNPFVRYAPADPHALASALEGVVDMADFEVHSREAAASVRGSTWDDAGATVDAIFRRALAAEGLG
jgi:hypothetical protein